MLALGGGALGLYLMSAKKAGNAQTTGVQPMGSQLVGTAARVAPNPNIGSLSAYPVSTDQMGNIIYGDNGPRPVDFINAANTSDIPLVPLAAFNFKAQRRQLSAGSVSQAQMRTARTAEGGASAGQASNDAMLAKLWPTWTQAERAAYLQNGAQLGVTGLSATDINFYSGQLTGAAGGATAGNYTMSDFMQVKTDIANARMG
jgi:hypothetical protein